MPGIKIERIRFGNSNTAQAAFPSAENNIQEVMTALALPAPAAVILIIGGAADLDEQFRPRLTQLYSRGIAKAAVEIGGLVVSGGTQAGVMSLIGQGVASRGKQTNLLGIAPAPKVSYPGSEVAEGTALEPNHTHFILTEGSEWGDETATMFRTVAHFSGTATTGADKPKPAPVVAVMAGGGEVTKAEALRAVRQNIPLILIEGSGGFADEVAAACKEKDAAIDDPVMAEIVADGELHCFPIGASVTGLERLVIRELGTDKVLLQTWETFAAYDLNAGIQQKRFDRLQLSIIGLGLLGTLLVIVQQIWAPRDASHVLLEPKGIWWVVQHILILIPILLTALITAASRFKQGSKWLLLRAASEGIKREIYRYRTRSTGYETTPEQVLTQRVEDITRRTMRTEVNLSALKPYDKNKGFPPYMYAAQGGDDGFSRLTPDRYVTYRLNDQLGFFSRKTVYYEKQLRRLSWGTFVVGGLGTYLAAVGWQVWVALTTAIVAALGTYLGYRQTEHTLMKYNQTATDLANVKAWWDSLSAEEQAQRVNINSLVDHTEQVLQTELDGWIQQMQNALAELRKGQEAAAIQAQKPAPETEATITTSVVGQTKVVTVSTEQKEETVVATVKQVAASSTAATAAEATATESEPTEPTEPAEPTSEGTTENSEVPVEEFEGEETEVAGTAKPVDDKLYQ